MKAQETVIWRHFTHGYVLPSLLRVMSDGSDTVQMKIYELRRLSKACVYTGNGTVL